MSGHTAASLPPEFRDVYDADQPASERPTQVMLAHETGAFDRRVAHPDRAAELAAKKAGAKYPPHQLHHADLGWGYDGVKYQQQVGNFKRHADRGIKYGESMREAVEHAKQANATLNR